MSPVAISAIMTLFEAVLDFRRAAMQRGEWTPEQEIAFQGKAEKTFAANHWLVQEPSGTKPAVTGS